MIKIKKINKEIVKPIPLECVPIEKIKGYCLFPDLYCNIFLVARKKSGKTSAIFKILKSCIGKHTKIYIFASTIHKDQNLLHIVKYLKAKGNEVETFTSLKDHLEPIVNGLQVADVEEEEKPKLRFIVSNNDNDDQKPKSKKETKISPEYVFVFDDLGNELRNPLIDQLLKTNRHYKSKVILSSQYVNDLKPESRRQIDYYLLFGGHSIDKVQTIYTDADLPIDFDLFLKLYQNATTNKFNFFYVDVRDVVFKKNFNYLYQIT